RRFWRWRRSVFAQLIEEMEERYAHQRVEQREQKGSRKVEVHRLAEQGLHHYPVKELVEHIEKKDEQHAHDAVLRVDADADRCREVADQRFDDAEHAERVLRKRILRETDKGADHEAADLAAAHQCEVDHHQQRHLDEAEKLEEEWYVNLKQDGGEGNEEKYPRAKARRLPLAPTAEE